MLVVFAPPGLAPASGERARFVHVRASTRHSGQLVLQLVERCDGRLSLCERAVPRPGCSAAELPYGLAPRRRSRGRVGCVVVQYGRYHGNVRAAARCDERGEVVHERGAAGVIRKDRLGNQLAAGDVRVAHGHSAGPHVLLVEGIP